MEDYKIMAPGSHPVKPRLVKNSDWKFIYGGDGFWAQADLINPEYAYAEASGGEIGRVNLKMELRLPSNHSRVQGKRN